MGLTPMQYKDFVWPHNPRTYSIEYRREMGVHKVPFGRYHLQDLGPTRRVMTGEGEFVGEDAYETFKKLATVFYSEGPGTLIHPVWQCANAYFVELSLTQEPKKNYVRYRFTFWESYDGYEAAAKKTESGGETGEGTSSTTETGKETGTEETGVWHTVVKGETLWGIAQKYGVELSEIIAKNPGVKNPSLIYPGERVRVK